MMMEAKSLLVDATIYLSKINIFSKVDRADLEILAPKLKRRSFLRNDVIFHQGDPGDSLYCVVEGLVRVSIVSQDGRESDIALVLPGDCFGEMSVLDGGQRSATATAVEPTQALALSREDFLKFLGEHPPVAAQIIALLVRRLRATDEMVGDMIFLDVPTRVAKKLVELAGTHPERTSESDRVTLPVGHEELSLLVGSSRETVSRALTGYRKLGIVSTSHRRITITDLKALQAISTS